MKFRDKRYDVELFYNKNELIVTSERPVTFTIPLTPNSMNESSDQISAVSFFTLPWELVDSPCIALALQNGSFYLLTMAGRVLFTFCGFQSQKFSCNLSCIQHITGNANNTFASAFALGFSDGKFIALLTMTALIQCVRQNLGVVYHLTENAQPVLNGFQIQFGENYISTIAALTCVSLKNLIDKVPKSSAFMMENTNIILVHPRPFLVKLCPFAGSVIGELSAPSYVLNQLKMLGPAQLPDGSAVTARGEEFEYVFCSHNGEIYVSTLYSGAFIVDVLDLAIGFLAGDRIEVATKCTEADLNNNIDPNSDLALETPNWLQQAKANQIDLSRISPKSYQIPTAQYVVNRLPHVVALGADGALLLTRIDLLEVIAVDYHIDYIASGQYELQVEGDELCVFQKSGGIIKKWIFELPSLVFKNVV